MIKNRYHHVYSMLTNPVIATDDVVITGIRVTDFTEQANTVLYGTEGYVISIEKNPLIQSLTDAQTIANTVGAKIAGMRFRPMSLTCGSDPSVEAGDVAYVSTRKGVYQTVLTNVIFSVGRSMKLTCDAQSPIRNSAIRYSATTKAIIEARKNTEVKLTAYDLMVQQLNNLVSHSFGLYKTADAQPDGSVIYYLHDKPTLAESMKIWKQTADAFAISTDGGVTYTAGFDAEGNAVFNILSAIGINADWIRAGKIMSGDGKTLIDLNLGVANSDNIAITDNVANGYPLRMLFDIDEDTGTISKVKLKWAIDKFRTSSTTASSGGNSSTTSESGGGSTETSTDAGEGIYTTNSGGGETLMLPDSTVSGNTGAGGDIHQSTGGSDGAVGIHNHSMDVSGHSHSVSIGIWGGTVLTRDHTHSIFWPTHSHSVDIPAHTHNVNIPSHTHPLDYGIQETPVTSNAIDIYIDSTLRAQTTDAQGVIDLTQWITTTGWHEIELRSTTLKRISARLVIKSYIKM